MPRIARELDAPIGASIYRVRAYNRLGDFLPSVYIDLLRVSLRKLDPDGIDGL